MGEASLNKNVSGTAAAAKGASVVVACDMDDGVAAAATIVMSCTCRSVGMERVDELGVKRTFMETVVAGPLGVDSRRWTTRMAGILFTFPVVVTVVVLVWRKMRTGPSPTSCHCIVSAAAAPTTVVPLDVVFITAGASTVPLVSFASEAAADDTDKFAEGGTEEDDAEGSTVPTAALDSAGAAAGPRRQVRARTSNTQSSFSSPDCSVYSWGRHPADAAAVVVKLSCCCGWFSFWLFSEASTAAFVEAVASTDATEFVVGVVVGGVPLTARGLVDGVSAPF